MNVQWVVSSVDINGHVVYLSKKRNGDIEWSRGVRMAARFKLKDDAAILAADWLCRMKDVWKIMGVLQKDHDQLWLKQLIDNMQVREIGNSRIPDEYEMSYWQ